MYHLYHRNNWVGEFASLADAMRKAGMMDLGAWQARMPRIGVRDCVEFHWGQCVIVKGYERFWGR